MSDQYVRLERGGLVVGSTFVPLIGGALHYWHHDPESWRPALLAMKEIGFRLVDTYVPWSEHETAAGRHDFGDVTPARDLGRFLDLVHELGLYALVRPGPHVNAELTGFGIPERVLWDPECQARSPGGQPVVLPVPPRGFPVPSYASNAFHVEVAAWFSAVGAVLAPRLAPAGAVVLVQVDNEGACYFRDGAFDQDHHPDAVARFRDHLQARYGTLEALRAAYGDPELTFARVAPPRRFTADTEQALVPLLDWTRAQEALLGGAFRRMRGALERAGVRGVPFTHNLPPGEGGTPLDPELLLGAVDLVGLDYYHSATPVHRRTIARRTSELVTRSDVQGTPAIACELGAGFPPFFVPCDELDQSFATLTALAHGLDGYVVYMAVERDRWIGAPIDAAGRRRPSALAWQAIARAVERTRLWETRTEYGVAVVLPRVLRHRARALHALGPLSAALVEVGGAGLADGAREDALGASLRAASEFLDAAEQLLDARGIPFARVAGDVFVRAPRAAAVSLVVSAGDADAALVAAVEGLGARAAWGPLAPTGARAPLASGDLAAFLDGARPLSYGPLAPGLTLSIRRDARGAARALFVGNSGTEPEHARVAAAGARSARDALTWAPIALHQGHLDLDVPGRTVRFIALDPE